MIYPTILGSSNRISKEIYAKSNQQVEKWSKITDFAMKYISMPSTSVPLYVLCYVKYYATDVGNDAFQSQYYMW